MKKLWTAIALILGMMGILTACGSSQSSLSNRDEEVQRCRFDTIEEVREKVDDEKFYSLIEKVYEKGGFHLREAAQPVYDAIGAQVDKDIVTAYLSD